jgi:hypothetical protein
MTNQHSIKPPQELLENLEQLWFQGGISVADLLTKSYQAGADQELEACCDALDGINPDKYWSQRLRAARRPKPPSLKEQALQVLRPLSNPVMLGTPEYRLYEPQAEIIRRALEALPDD